LPGPHPHLVITINNIGRLYDPDGHPKNSGLGRIFDALINVSYAAVPIDLILICSIYAIPPAFRAGSASRSTRMLRILPSPCP
jgi:hypothetical protein